MPDRIELERRVKAPPTIVFAYFTDPERYIRWMGMEATLDARPGGLYRVRVPQGHVAVGEFVAVEEPRRVVFTWGWEDDPGVPPGSSRVEITLEPDGDETVVRLIHSGLPDTAVDMHTHGWSRYLDRLVVAAAGGDPGSDSS